VLVATAPVDFRKGAEGLAALVREQMGSDPFSGAVYVFRAKRAQRPTFCIPFSICDSRLSLASIVWTNVAGVSVSSWQGIDVHLYGRAA
jgi:transposase